jgi:hypothetical protein
VALSTVVFTVRALSAATYIATALSVATFTTTASSSAFTDADSCAILILAAFSVTATAAKTSLAVEADPLPPDPSSAIDAATLGSGRSVWPPQEHVALTVGVR